LGIPITGFHTVLWSAVDAGIWLLNDDLINPFKNFQINFRQIGSWVGAGLRLILVLRTDFAFPIRKPNLAEIVG
jgi:hypothetical protein